MLAAPHAATGLHVAAPSRHHAAATMMMTGATAIGTTIGATVIGTMTGATEIDVTALAALMIVTATGT